MHTLSPNTDAMKRTSPLAHLKAVVAALAVIAWLGAVASGQDAKPAVEDAKPAEAPKTGRTTRQWITTALKGEVLSF